MAGFGMEQRGVQIWVQTLWAVGLSMWGGSVMKSLALCPPFTATMASLSAGRSCTAGFCPQRTPTKNITCEPLVRSGAICEPPKQICKLKGVFGPKQNLTEQKCFRERERERKTMKFSWETAQPVRGIGR